MKTPANVAQAVDELTALGYVDSFRAEGGGLRAAGMESCRHAPEEIQVEKAYRFEVDSSPDGQTLVLALRCRPDGHAGTYVLPYGPALAAEDADALARLGDIRPFLSK